MLLKRAGRVHALLALLITTAFVVMGMSLMPSLAQVNGEESGESTTTVNIDPEAKGSITIHKYENPSAATNLPNYGSPLEAEQVEGLNPLEGVKFEIYKIDLDLTNSDNWNKVSTLRAQKGCKAAYINSDNEEVPLGIGTEDKGGSTNEFGVVTASELAVGAYIVCETDNGTNPIVKRAAPFIVIIPMPEYAEGENGAWAATGGWNYNVHVYPKNEMANVSKTVNKDDLVHTGDEVVWTITAQVPQLAQNETLSSLKVVDELDPNLSFKEVRNVKLGGEELKTLDHYTVTQDSENPKKITIELTEQGRKKANSGDTFSMELVTIVDTVPDGGSIGNTANLTIHDGEVEVGSDDETEWGYLNIVKRAAGASGTPLQGAEFDIYQKTSTENKCQASDFENDLVATGVSGADGKLYFKGVEPAKRIGLVPGNYCIRESKAPAGYVLPDITDGNNWHKVTIVAGTTANKDIPIENNKPTFPQLPITGSATQLALTLGGIAVLLTAIGVGFYNTRLRRADN